MAVGQDLARAVILPARHLDDPFQAFIQRTAQGRFIEIGRQDLPLADHVLQAQGDRAILAKQLNISPQQMKYVTHTEAGEGLIFYGNVVLPFLDRFPQNTELYRVMTTRPEEVGGT